MSTPDEGKRKPSLQEKIRPLEMIGIAAVVAVFTGLIVLLSTRELPLAGIFAGIGFVIVVVVIAMLGLALGFGEGTVKGKDLPNPGEDTSETH